MIAVTQFRDLVVGDDWSPAFAAAIALASATDPVVYVPASRTPYTVRKPGPRLPSIDLRGRPEIVLKGDGPGSVIKMIGSGGHGSWHMIACGGDTQHVVIQDLLLDGNKANLTELDSGQHTHLLLLGGTVTGGYLHHASVSNVIFKDAAGDGVAILPLTGEYGAGQEVKDVSISNCRFLGCGRSGVSNQRLVECLRVSDCYFEGISDQSIDIEPTTSVTDGNRSPRWYTITGNHFRHNTAAMCVSIAGVGPTDLANGVTFTNNTIIGGNVSIIYTRGLKFNHNHILSGTDTSPVITLKRNNSYCQIRGNYLERVEGAVGGKVLHLTGLDGNEPSHCDIADNQILQHGTTDSDNCIVLLQGQNLFFHHNRVVWETPIRNAVKVTSGSVVTQESNQLFGTLL